MCGVKTNVVTSVQVSVGYAHDYTYFKGLVDKTAQSGFTMKEVSADKGYLGASNMLATLQHGAVPYIPFKSNSVPDSRGSYGAKSELWTRMYHFYALNRAEFLQHYHKRSNVETTFHMIKAKFGQRLRSRTLTGKRRQRLSRRIEHAGDVAARRYSLHSIQVKLGAGLTRKLWSKVGTVDQNVSFL